MDFITIAEAQMETENRQDRAKFYFRLDANFKAEFAIKQSFQNHVTSHKANNIFEVFAWMGFTELAYALIYSPKFQSKYRTEIIPILDTLIIFKNMNDSAFMLKSDGNWTYTQDPEDLIPIYGEDIFQQISNIAGRQFIKDHTDQLKQQNQLNDNIKLTLKEIKSIEETAKIQKVND